MSASEPRTISYPSNRKITLGEVLEACWVVQIAEQNDLAFVFDTWGNVLLATLEDRRRSLPPVPLSPAAGWESAGDQRLYTTLQVPRSLAAWLNACRRHGVVLQQASPALDAWWMDGVLGMRPEDVSVLVGVAD